MQNERFEEHTAHADKKELMEWEEGFIEKPKMTFVIYGEEKSSQTLAAKLREELGWNTVTPTYLESFLLFKHI